MIKTRYPYYSDLSPTWLRDTPENMYARIGCIYPVTHKTLVKKLQSIKRAYEKQGVFCQHIILQPAPDNQGVTVVLIDRDPKKEHSLYAMEEDYGFETEIYQMYNRLINNSRSQYFKHDATDDFFTNFVDDSDRHINYTIDPMKLFLINGQNLHYLQDWRYRWTPKASTESKKS